MRKIEEARTILKELQVPAKQQSDLCCYVLLAMAGIGRRDQCLSEVERKKCHLAGGLDFLIPFPNSRGRLYL